MASTEAQPKAAPRVWRRPERWWWLVVFLLISVVLHVGVGLGSRVFGGHQKNPPAPKSDEIEVALGPAGEAAAAPKVQVAGKAQARPAQPLTEDIPKPRNVPVPRVNTPVARPQFVARVHVPAPRQTVADGPRAATVPVTKIANTTPTAIFKASTPEKEPQPTRVINPERRAVPLPVGRVAGIQDAAPVPVAISKPDRVPSLAERKVPQPLGSGGAKSDNGPETPSEPKVAEKTETTPAPDKAAGTGPGAGKLSGAGVAEAPGDGRGATVSEPRIAVRRGIPFGDITGLSHGGDNNGGGSIGTLGVSGGGATGQPFRLQLSRQTASDVGGTPEHIVYVLDVSGSMSEDGKIQKARAALHKAVGELLSDDLFTFITFSGHAHPYSNGLKPASNFYVSTMETNFDLVEPNGETNMSEALDLALSMQGVEQIFLMSDGEPTIGITDFDELSSHIRIKNVNHVHITTFALGTGEQFEGIKFLKRIAAENGGQYRYVDLSPR